MTSYFDLLTYPLLTLGAPLVLWTVLKSSHRFIENLRNIVRISVFWGIGYGGMWSLKWLIGGFVTGENVLSDAVEQVVYRTSSVVSDTVVTISKLAHELQYSSRQYTWILSMLILAVYFVYQVVKIKKINWKMIINYMVISMFPMVWYLAMRNHSFGHHWFTYRELAISIYAMATCMLIHGEE